MWVRERITATSHRVPVHAFEQGPVLRACDAAIRQARLRTTALVTVAISALMTTVLGWLTAGTAIIVGVVVCWAVYLADRYTSQQRLNALLGEHLPTAPADPPSHALPYVKEFGKGGIPRDRFLGAGLQAWQPAVIGIDIEPAPESQDDEPTSPLMTSPESGSRGEEVTAAVLAALFRHGKQTGARKPMKHFKDVDLHAYVVQRLSNPAPSHDRSHPQPRIDVTGVAGISAERWDNVDDAAWRGLKSLAVNDRVSAFPDNDTARRYIWARITAWNGQLVASILVHFAYEGGFLRVTVRPHIMTPLNPAVGGLSAEDPRAPRWFVLAALHAVGDVAAGLSRFFRQTHRQVPELGREPGPVSLREVYSLRWISDMHMNDDARYYIQMMQRRVFDSVEIFLRDHNVDIAAYKQQATAIYNFGVMNGGTMNGSVQAAPFSNDVQMS